MTQLCNWIRNKETGKFIWPEPNTGVWVSRYKKGSGHRINLINVLKREQSLRDRGSTASRGTCEIRALNITAAGTVLQKEPLGRGRGMQQQWVEILE